MYKNLITGVIIAVFSLSGCANVKSYLENLFKPRQREINARLYDLDSGDIFKAIFYFSGTTQGRAIINIAGEDQFEGEYQTMYGKSALWGHIYAAVYGYPRISENSKTDSPGEMVGTAIVVNKMKNVIECEYVTNTSVTSPQGQGVCIDKNKRKFKLLFGS